MHSPFLQGKMSLYLHIHSDISVSLTISVSITISFSPLPCPLYCIFFLYISLCNLKFMKSQIVDCIYRIDVRTVGEAPSIDRCRASCNLSYIYLEYFVCLCVCVCVTICCGTLSYSFSFSNQTDQGDFS